ncbi:MAG TPA: cytochrome c [Gemmatales bacterium]|nr:cytochrome c [Gemmatales bacterium]
MRLNQRGFLVVLLAGLGLLSGCSDAAYSEGDRYHFQPYTILEGTDTVKEYTLPKEKAKELDQLLINHFGTPYKPEVKCNGSESEINELQLTPEKMALGSKLFLAQCAHCHGKEGNGNGKSALTLNPKPRDYRFGKFKYVSTIHKDDDGKSDTGKASYPCRADIIRTIKMGLPGAGMQSMDQADEKLDALASYVMHLALRGLVEYRMTRFWLEEDEKPSERDVTKELKEILKQWANDAKASYVPTVPWEEIEREGVKNNWAKGRDLFLTKAGCIDCHGKNGMANPEELKNIAAMKDDWGGPIKPRSFVSEPFRGGNRPIDQFNRIKLGIKPSRMQAIDGTKFSDADIWNIVGFIRSLEAKK